MLIRVRMRSRSAKKYSMIRMQYMHSIAQFQRCRLQLAFQTFNHLVRSLLSTKPSILSQSKTCGPKRLLPPPPLPHHRAHAMFLPSINLRFKRLASHTCMCLDFSEHERCLAET